MPQTTSLIGIQFVQRGKKFAMAYESAAAPAGVARHAAHNRKLCSGSGRFRRYKGLRLIARLRGNRFYKFAARGQNKFLYSCRSKNYRAIPDHVRTSAKRQARKINIALQIYRGSSQLPLKATAESLRGTEAELLQR